MQESNVRPSFSQAIDEPVFKRLVYTEYARANATFIP